MRALLPASLRAALLLSLAAALLACEPSATRTPATTASSSASPPITSPQSPPAPAEPPSLRHTANAPCVVHSEHTHFAEPLNLLFHGKAFATVDDVRRVELRADGHAATVEVSTESSTLTAEVRLDGLPLAPRTPAAHVHDGWLTIWRARAKAVKNDALAVEVSLPSIVKPAEPLALAYPCGELTFEPEIDSPPYNPRLLKAGTKVPLRLAPRGRIVAWLDVPRGTPSEPAAWDVDELERKGGAVRIGIPGEDVLVQGWVDSAALSKSLAPEMVGGLAGVAAPRRWPGTFRCSADVPVYVRDEGAVVRVGILHGNATIPRGPVHDGEVSVDLGLDVRPAAPTLQPFVRAAAIAGCVAQ